MSVCVLHWDAFTRRPGKGNPAGIVLSAQNLSDSEMQAIAQSIGFNDTAFVLPSHSADLRIRYFAPRREVDLCGHATIAAFSALHRDHLLPYDGIGRDYTLETRAGVLKIGVEMTEDGDPLIVMNQGIARFAKFNGSRDELAAALGISVSDLDDTLPIIYGNTGRWTLVVPVIDLKTMQKMRPSPANFAAILTEIPDASIHPFCQQTINPKARMHARHFSSPGSGTLEDAVTGTASGVLGAYDQTFIRNAVDLNVPLIVEQGYEVQREGTVQVWATPTGDHYAVRIAGSACFVRNIEFG